MSDNPNVAQHRRGHEAFSRGNLDDLAEIIAEDTVWHQAGRNAISGDYEGRDAVFALFGRMGELTGGILGLEDQFFMGPATGRSRCSDSEAAAEESSERGAT